MNKVVAIVAGLALIAGLTLFLVLRGGSDPEPAPVESAAPAAPAPTKKAEPPPPAAVAEAPRRAPAPKKAEPKAEEPAAPAAPTLATLVLESDVPGASVFIDRAFVGNTPLTVEGLAPGTKRVQLTADGFDSVQRSIDLVAGTNNISLRIKEVSLNARTAVVHRHGMGSCEGTLVATLDGLRYETANKNDAFSLPYAQVETFAVDYLQKNLRVKQRGGRTWNFTDKADNADVLFVFHRDVEAAREKLAAGYARAQ